MKLAPILVVEDSEKDAILIQHTLKRAEILNPVRVVDTAEAAIAYLGRVVAGAGQDQSPVPSIVFIDLVLPGASGHDVLAWLRKAEALRDLIRVVLTGSDDPQDLKRAYALGANCYLRKPLTVEQLTDPVVNIRALLAAQPSFT